MFPYLGDGHVLDGGLYFIGSCLGLFDGLKAECNATSTLFGDDSFRGPFGDDSFRA